jgi:CTP:molybdopterin cytidylyltransferase MocA
MDGDLTVGAVILAAGASRRYGSPKQLVVVDGQTLLEHAIGTAATAGLSPVAAVVPIWLSRPAALDDRRLHWVRNPFPERGLSLSLRLGIEAIADEVAAVVILLGDQPRVPAEVVAALLDARGPRPVVATEAGGVLAPPVLVERTHFDLVDDLHGDVGLRPLLRDTKLVTSVPVAEHARDVNTPADLERLGGARIGHMFDSGPDSTDDR